MTDRRTSTEQDRAIRDTAVRESHQYTSAEANYPIANTARTAQQQGRERAHA